MQKGWRGVGPGRQARLTSPSTSFLFGSIIIGYHWEHLGTNTWEYTVASSRSYGRCVSPGAPLLSLASFGLLGLAGCGREVRRASAASLGPATLPPTRGGGAGVSLFGFTFPFLGVV